MQIFTYSCLEALNIGSQNRVSNVRRPFNPSQHCSVVCHLKNKKKQTNKSLYSSFIPMGFAQMQFLDVNTKCSGFVLTEKPQDINQHALEDNNRTLLPVLPTLKTQS